MRHSDSDTRIGCRNSMNFVQKTGDVRNVLNNIRQQDFGKYAISEGQVMRAKIGQHIYSLISQAIQVDVSFSDISATAQVDPSFHKLHRSDIGVRQGKQEHEYNCCEYGDSRSPLSESMLGSRIGLSGESRRRPEGSMVRATSAWPPSLSTKSIVWTPVRLGPMRVLTPSPRQHHPQNSLSSEVLIDKSHPMPQRASERSPMTKISAPPDLMPNESKATTHCDSPSNCGGWEDVRIANSGKGAAAAY